MRQISLVAGMFVLAGWNFAAEPAAVQQAGVELGEMPVYGRIALVESAATGDVRVIFGQETGDHDEVVKTDRKVTVISVRGGQRQAPPVESESAIEGDDILEFSRQGTTLRLYRAGSALWHATNAPAGRLPVRTYGPVQMPVFVQKRGPVLAQDDFARETVGTEDAWVAQGGWWRTLYDPIVAASPNPFVCAGSADRAAGFLITGHLFWNDLEVAVSVKPEVTAETGVVFAFRDPQNCCRASIRSGPGGGSLVLTRVKEGVEKQVAARPVNYPAGRWVRLAARCTEGGRVEVLLDDVQLINVDASRADTFGKAGLFIRNGQAQFDDFAARTYPVEPPAEMPVVTAVSRSYGSKPWEKDADDQLFRWARNSEGWSKAEFVQEGVRYRGECLRLPVFGDFTFSLPAVPAGSRVQLRDWLGTPLHTEVVSRTAPLRLARHDGGLFAGDRRLSGSAAGEGISIGIFQAGDGSWVRPGGELRSATVRQDLFEEAPVGWMPVSGTWENSSRWKCEPKWAFFSGMGNDDAILFSKLRYEGNQVHEFYFGMKDVFNREYELRRYALHDVNFSFLTDGVDVFSGYTFMYGGFDNKASYLYRGRECVATNASFRFKDFVSRQSIFDQHVFWWPVRVEKVASRIRVFFDEALVFDYTDPAEKIPAGGHVALWTHRNGVMYGRLSSSAEALKPDAGVYCRGGQTAATAGWHPVNSSRVTVESPGRGRVRVVNRYGGGDFAVWNELEKPVDLNERSTLLLPLEMPEGVKVNVHIRVNGQYFIVPLTAPTGETYRVLGDGSAVPPNIQPAWRMLVSRPVPASTFLAAPDKTSRGYFMINLLEQVRKQLPVAPAYALDLLIIGNSSHADYLMEGLTGNAAGTSYELGTPQFR